MRGKCARVKARVIRRNAVIRNASKLNSVTGCNVTDNVYTQSQELRKTKPER